MRLRAYILESDCKRSSRTRAKTKNQAAGGNSMTINIQLPPKANNLKPVITVIGVGGAGGNAVNNMIASSLEGVNFIVANTDAQALDNSICEKRIQLGARITQGLGAGATPQVGASAAEESMDEIESHILGSNMVFITAGMGGGTGTGAAPVIAKMAKDNNILTVGVITKPFQFEGVHRMRIAESGIVELQRYVDTLIIIPNQNLFRLANERTTFADAFKMADDVLHAGVRGITDLMIMPGLINLDFADIRTVMSEMGKAMMGTGEGEGDRRALDAAEAAISNPLLDDISMKGARGVLINITGGPDMTLFEVDEAANRIREEVDPEANIIFGSTFNKDMTGKIRVSVVSTGIGGDQNKLAQPLIQSAQQNQPFSANNDARRTAFAAMTTGFNPAQQKMQPTRPSEMPKADSFPLHQHYPAQAGTSQSALEEKKNFTAHNAELRHETPVTSRETEPQARIELKPPVEREKQQPQHAGSRIAAQARENSFSLLQKLGLVGRPPQAAAPQENRPVQREKADLFTASQVKSREDDDDRYVDMEEVPAFLRRKQS